MGRARRYDLPAVTLFCVLAGCGESRYIEPPPPAVTVATPEIRTVTEYVEVTGTTAAVQAVDIRARVEGFLQRAAFEEGATVEAGTLLYVIDPDEYEASVQRARARLRTAEASTALAEATLARREQANRTGAVSDLEVLESRAQVDVSQAQIQAAQAELRRAELNLGYTRITAPLTGRVGRSEVDVGNLVGAGEQTLLTKMVQYDPIYVYFSINERQLLRLSQAADDRATSDEERRKVVAGLPVQVARSTDEGYPFEGKLDFGDLGVEQETGTFLMRAVVPNPPPVELVPGLFMRGRLPLGERPDSLLVSERALGQDQQGRYLLVVNGEDVVEYRPVEVGDLVDDMRVIRKGITAGDRVITAGVLYARPGSRVTPQSAEASEAGEPGEAPESASGTASD